MLGPVLEKLAGEFNGRFLLAKVNSDHNPMLSSQYNVRGIPAVKAFWNGRVVDEFVGAQPEPKVRQFIQHLTAKFQPSQPFGQQTKRSSYAPKDLLEQARKLFQQGKGCQAWAYLQKISDGSDFASAQKLLPLAQFLCEADSGFSISGSVDLDTAYRQVAAAVNRREYATAMYNLLIIMNQDRDYRNGQAQKVMAGLFELLGEDDPLTQAYRQQTAQIRV
jgi:putative thioredoxin